MYDNLGKDALYGTYLEVYAESFGYESSNPANHTNLQAGISDFHNSHCATAPTDNSAPQVSLTAPSDNSKVSDQTDITANASDDIGVTKVEFYADNALVGSSAAEPYKYSWDTTAITDGTHTIYAKAYDASGKSASSAVATVTKPAPNQPPTISLSAPTGGASHTEPATVSIKADEADSDGSVSKVEFYNGSTKLGESLSAPYEFNWTGVVAGNYTISAKATDNEGCSTAQSDPVSISVTKPPVAVINPPTDLGLGLTWDWSKFKNNMIASWKTPVDSQNVSGYKINVYAWGTLVKSTNLVGASKTNYTIKNLIVGGKYKIQLFSRGASDSELSTSVEKSATYNCFGVCWLAQ